jgi:hypothetical protein
LKRLPEKLARRLPRTAMFDWVHLMIRFYRFNRRFPRRDSALFNDYVFFLLNSAEADDALRQITTDKLYAKRFVNHILGREYTPETLAVFSHPEELDPAMLPDECIIKPTHLSGSFVHFDREKKPMPAADLEMLRGTFDRSWYWKTLERNYRNLRPQLICEEVVSDPLTIKDYKVLCFAGVPRLIMVISERGSARKFAVYTTGWERLDIALNLLRADTEDRPERLDEMLAISHTLAAHFSSIRVDFFITGERLFVGELTHAPGGALARFGSLEEERIFSRQYFGSDANAREAFAALNSRRAIASLSVLQERGRVRDLV